MESMGFSFPMMANAGCWTGLDGFPFSLAPSGWMAGLDGFPRFLVSIATDDRFERDRNKRVWKLSTATHPRGENTKEIRRLLKRLLKRFRSLDWLFHEMRTNEIATGWNSTLHILFLTLRQRINKYFPQIWVLVWCSRGFFGYQIWFLGLNGWGMVYYLGTEGQNGE